MKMTKESGFTLVEVTIALAVSASLILLTVGLSTMVGRRQFEDSLIEDKEFIQTQYSEVKSGINARINNNNTLHDICPRNGAIIGNNKNCLSIGRLINVTEDNIISRPVIAQYKNGWPNKNKSLKQNLTDDDSVTFFYLNDSSSTALSSTKSLGKGIKKSAWHLTNGGSDSDKTALLLLKSPLDGNVLAMAVSNPSDESNYYVKIPKLDPTNRLAKDDYIVYGISNTGSGQKGGLICVASGNDSASISVNNNVDFDTDGYNPRDDCRNWDGE